MDAQVLDDQLEYCLEDLLGAMNDRDRWQERESQGNLY